MTLVVTIEPSKSSACYLFLYILNYLSNWLYDPSQFVVSTDVQQRAKVKNGWLKKLSVALYELQDTFYM